MKPEIENNEWIEEYLNGDLSGPEKETFQKRLEDDPGFAREVERHRQLREIITEGAYLKVKNDLKSIHLEKIRIKRRNKRIAGFGIGGLIIGMFLVMVVPEVLEKNKPGNEPPAEVITQKDSVVEPVQKSPLFENKPEESQVHAVYDHSADKPAPSEIYQNQQDDSVTHRTNGIPQVKPNSDPPTVSLPPEPAPDSVLKTVTAAQKTDNPVGVDCGKVKIEGDFRESESCNNKPTGIITIDRRSLTGGSAPYTFSLNQVSFRDTVVFSGLFPGSYALFVKDANNCISRLGLALIRSADCTYQAVFAPLRGETWTVPADPERNGTLIIFSKTGALVYSARFNTGETMMWNGTTISGQDLPMGIYQFDIRYSDGSSFIGNVTIVR